MSDPLVPLKIVHHDNAEQLKLLFDYTKFHIGLYTTLAGVLIAAVARESAASLRAEKPFIAAAILAIVFAGLAGGIVASSLPERKLSEDFWVAKTGPFSWRWLTIRQWAYVEHTLFWIGVGFVLLAFLPEAFRLA